MGKIVNKKNTYFLVLLVICLLGIVIVPTYAKFGSSYVTEDDVVGVSFDFDLKISNIEEYEEIIIPAGKTEQFNVEITNDTGNKAYYGIWYMMVIPKVLPEDNSVEIGNLSGSDATTTGSIDVDNSVVVPIAIVNNSSSEVKINIGVSSSDVHLGDIKYINGKHLIANEIELGGVNVPNLDDGNLIPVYYDEISEVWRKADKSNINNSWYDYESKKWANAVSISDSTDRETYQAIMVGEEIPDSVIDAFYVWIPRYKYKVWNITRQGGEENAYSYSAYTKGIEIEWESGTDNSGNVECDYNVMAADDENNLSDICVYNKIDSVVINNSNSNYNDAWYTHPAFTFGEEQKTGFWIGKFETTGDEKAPTILPDAKSLISKDVSNQFTISKIFQDYGLSNNIDAHMLTNLEWGALVYLTHSVYGLCDGESCRDAYINNSESMYTGRSAGVLATDSSVNKYGTYNYEGYLLDNEGLITADKDVSKVASTTGNITGVYDVVGGAYEYVMGSMLNENGEFSLSSSEKSWNGLPLLNNKYYNSYSYGSEFLTQSSLNRSRLGDATAEVTGSIDDNGIYAWQSGSSITGSSSYFVDIDSPWFVRGGFFGSSNSSSFEFGMEEGDVSFRVSLS